ncbi:MAG: beta-ketoacyl-ACP synthase II [Gaiellaceae bacterium]
MSLGSNSNGSNGRRRVVVTGLGCVSPLGNSVDDSWRNLLAGKSGAAEITQFDHSNSAYNVHFACELKDFDPTVWIDRKAARRMDRFAQMILAAARQAESDSGIDISREQERVGASVATGIGGLRSYQDCYDILLARGPDRVSPFSIPSIIPNMGAGWVSIELGTKGPLMSECTACAASNMAIGDAADAIRMGRADVMLAGGTEAPITEVGIAGFDAMRALSRRNDDPERASRPFDRARDGLVMGEAAAILVLEDLEHARARGAKIYGELAGYGVSSDAAHMTEPDPTGENPARAMKMAMQDAGVEPTEIGYINAHATSTPLGDASETRVIKQALGEEHASRTPVSSTKGATGHCFGAAGAIEAVFTTLALHDGKLPPTINYESEDPECDLDYIPNESRDAPDLRAVMSNSFGFGGHNATIVIRRFEEN